MTENVENTTEELKKFTRAEVQKHNEKSDPWIIIDDKVYNVTDFLAEHPGGEEVLLEQAGQDGSEAFEDIGHSTDARKMMEKYLIGELIEEEKTKSDQKSSRDWTSHTTDENASGSWPSWVIPITLGLLATVIYRYFISAQ